jgi:hypothetical protein
MITDQKQQTECAAMNLGKTMEGEPNFRPKFDNPILSLGLLNLRKRVFLNTAAIL